MSGSPVMASVELAMDQCRDSLAELEDRFVAADDAHADPAELERLEHLVAAYAQLVAALREFVEHDRLGQASPVRLAQRLDAFVSLVEAASGDDSLHPTVAEAQGLAAAARATAGRVPG